MVPNQCAQRRHRQTQPMNGTLITITALSTHYLHAATLHSPCMLASSPPLSRPLHHHRVAFACLGATVAAQLAASTQALHKLHIAHTRPSCCADHLWFPCCHRHTSTLPSLCCSCTAAASHEPCVTSPTHHHSCPPPKSLRWPVQCMKTIDPRGGHCVARIGDRFERSVVAPT